VEYKDVAKDVANIGKNTEDIIKEIKTKNTQPMSATTVNEVENIANRINRPRIRSGSGFAYI